MNIEIIETELLVIGGGLAGTFAGIKAKEAGVESVTLVSKGKLGTDSISAFAAGAFTMIFPEDDRDRLLEVWCLSEAYGEGIYDEAWFDVWQVENYDRVLDMEKYGVEWEKTPDGHFERRLGRMGKTAGMFKGPQMMKAMAKKVKRSGIDIVGHTMITDLLTENGKPGGRVTGAIGFDVRTGEPRLFKAGAVVLASGGSSSKARGPCYRFQTGESCAMAYRAGATLGRFEVGDRLYFTSTEFDMQGLLLFIALGGRFVNSKGEKFMNEYAPELKDFASLSRISASSAMEVRAGRGPIYLDMTHFSPKDIEKMRRVIPIPVRMLERAGILIKDKIISKMECAPVFSGCISSGGGAVVNTHCETSLPGLFACGDAMSRAPHFVALPAAAISGARAGRFAAEYCKEAKEPRLDEGQIEGLMRSTFAPMEREDGIEPDHIIIKLLETVLPYEVTVISHGDRLEKAIAEVERIRDEEVPLLYASDPHYLRLANEVKSIALVLEMYLKSRLLRKETREGCVREDYPHTDNINWLKNSMLKQEDGKMRVWTEDIPVENYKIKPKRDKHLYSVFDVATKRGAPWG
jgi:succinate dehydrogenase/fumarate reductase flavoprotein subunit